MLVLEGGNAGNSTASIGATGGSVSNVGVTGLAAGTIFRSVASGNGGDGCVHGGAAGNITTLFVQNDDIGIKTGQAFGYNTQGGIFAGVGGNGTVPRCEWRGAIHHGEFHLLHRGGCAPHGSQSKSGAE